MNLNITFLEIEIKNNNFLKIFWVFSKIIKYGSLNFFQKIIFVFFSTPPPSLFPFFGYILLNFQKSS